MKRNRIFLYALTIFAAAAAMLAILLLMRSLQRNRQNAQLNTVRVEKIPEAELPAEERSEDWFVGDWAGLVTGPGEPDPGWTDFGVAALNFYAEQACLLRIYATGQGYEAKIGSSVWAVTEHTMDSITLCCTTASHEAEHIPDSIYYEQAQFEVGQTIALSYSAHIKSSTNGTTILFLRSYPQAKGAAMRVVFIHAGTAAMRTWKAISRGCFAWA